MTKIKRAYALLRRGKIFLQGYSVTTDGAIVAYRKVFISVDEDALSLGEKTAQLILESTTGIPHPKKSEEWAALQTPMLEAAGVKSWTTLAKGSKAIIIELIDARVQIEPSSGYGKESVVSHPECRVFSSLDFEDLGQAVARAFAECDKAHA